MRRSCTPSRIERLQKNYCNIRTTQRSAGGGATVIKSSLTRPHPWAVAIELLPESTTLAQSADVGPNFVLVCCAMRMPLSRAGVE